MLMIIKINNNIDVENNQLQLIIIKINNNIDFNNNQA